MTSSEANGCDAIVLFCLVLLRTLMWFITTYRELVVSCSGSVFSVGVRSCSYQKHNITSLRNAPQLLLNHCAVSHCVRNTFMRFHADSFMSQDTRPLPSPPVFLLQSKSLTSSSSSKTSPTLQGIAHEFYPQTCLWNPFFFFLSILLSSTAVTQTASYFKLIADPFPLWSQT